MFWETYKKIKEGADRHRAVWIPQLKVVIFPSTLFAIAVWLGGTEEAKMVRIKGGPFQVTKALLKGNLADAEILHILPPNFDPIGWEVDDLPEEYASKLKPLLLKYI